MTKQEQDKQELAERKVSILAIKKYYLRILDDHDRLRTRAEEAVKLAQEELRRVLTEHDAAPAKLVWCNDQIRLVAVAQKQKVVTPKLAKLKRLYAEIARLEEAE